MQTSPRIMNVAVPWCQHSPMFGQRASSQTVFSLQVLHDALEPEVVLRPGRAHLQPLRLGLAGPDELQGGFDGHGMDSLIDELTNPRIEGFIGRSGLTGQAGRRSPVAASDVRPADTIRESVDHAMPRLSITWFGHSTFLRPHARRQAGAVRSVADRQSGLSGDVEEAAGGRSHPGLARALRSHRRPGRRARATAGRRWWPSRSCATGSDARASRTWRR